MSRERSVPEEPFPLISRSIRLPFRKREARSRAESMESLVSMGTVNAIERSLSPALRYPWEVMDARGEPSYRISKWSPSRVVSMEAGLVTTAFTTPVNPPAAELSSMDISWISTSGPLNWSRVICLFRENSRGIHPFIPTVPVIDT